MRSATNPPSTLFKRTVKPCKCYCCINISLHATLHVFSTNNMLVHFGYTILHPLCADNYMSNDVQN